MQPPRWWLSGCPFRPERHVWRHQRALGPVGSAVPKRDKDQDVKHRRTCDPEWIMLLAVCLVSCHGSARYLAVGEPMIVPVAPCSTPDSRISATALPVGMLPLDYSGGTIVLISSSPTETTLLVDSARTRPIVKPTDSLPLTRRPVAVVAYGDSVAILDNGRSAVVVLDHTGRYVREERLAPGVRSAATLAPDKQAFLISADRGLALLQWSSGDTTAAFRTNFSWPRQSLSGTLLALGSGVAVAYRDTDGCFMSASVLQRSAARSGCLPAQLVQNVAHQAELFYSAAARMRRSDIPRLPFAFLGQLSGGWIVMRSPFPIDSGQMVAVDLNHGLVSPLRFSLGSANSGTWIWPTIMGAGFGATVVLDHGKIYCVKN